jgi:hypothetical protein
MDCHFCGKIKKSETGPGIQHGMLNEDEQFNYGCESSVLDGKAGWAWGFIGRKQWSH